MEVHEPTDAELLLQLDEVLKKSRENNPDSEYKAIQQFEIICDLKNASRTTKAIAWQRQGCSYYKVKNYHAAIGAFDKAITAGSGEFCAAKIFAHTYKGQALLKIRKYIDAREEFFTVLKIMKQELVTDKTDEMNEKAGLYGTILYQIGISLSKSGNDIEAVDYFDQAIALSEEKLNENMDSDPYGLSEKKQKMRKISHIARTSKSLSLCRLGRDQEALKLINNTISDLEGPGQKEFRKYLVSAQNVLGMIYLNMPEEQKTGKNESQNAPEKTGSKSIAAFNKAIESADDLGDGEKPLYIWRGYLNKGLALKSEQKFDEAILCFSEGLDKCGKFEPHLLYARGITKIELQKYDDGIKDLQEVQQFDPRYSPATLAISDAYRKKSTYYKEIELQQKLLESTTDAVTFTQENLKILSNCMRDSLNHVAWMFYALFLIGLGVFLGSLYFAFRQFPNTDPMTLAVSAIGGIDVILSMIFLSPTKIQKNRIDYSQWLMGYFNWINTQFAAGTILLERLQRVHSPSKPEDADFDWNEVLPVYSFLHTMTKDTLETIDKCCEFPDVQYSLSKKTVSKDTDTETGTKPADITGTGKTSTAKSSTSEEVVSAGTEKDKITVSPEQSASSAKTTDILRIPQGFTYISTGEEMSLGHKLPAADPEKGVPAIIFDIWKGAATDNRYHVPTRFSTISDSDEDLVHYFGKKPERLTDITVDEFSHDYNIFFGVKGYRSAKIHISILFYFLDDKQDYSLLKQGSDIIKAQDNTSKKNVFFIKYHEQKMIQDIHGGTKTQVYIDSIQLPHGIPISKAIGTHYIVFRIAEIIPGQEKYINTSGIPVLRQPEWLWESEPFKFTVSEKNS